MTNTASCSLQLGKSWRGEQHHWRRTHTPGQHCVIASSDRCCAAAKAAGPGNGQRERLSFWPLLINALAVATGRQGAQRNAAWSNGALKSGAPPQLKKDTALRRFAAPKPLVTCQMLPGAGLLLLKEQQPTEKSLQARVNLSKTPRQRRGLADKPAGDKAGRHFGGLQELR